MRRIENEKGRLYMNIPFLDLKAQQGLILDEIKERFDDIFSNTGFILGKHVAEFEKDFSRIQEAKFTLGVSSGTDALHVALLALGVGPGDEVVVPVNTFIATAEAVSHCGAIPLFADCDRFYNMDVDELEEILRGEKTRRPEGRKNSRVKAVIPVHLYGQPADMSKIMAISDKYGADVVEDACQAHLARYNGKSVGTFGQFGCFSFYPGKNLGAFGEAGAVVTDDEGLYDRARLFRQHGETEKYNHKVIGHNYRMAALQGAVLSTKLKYIKRWTESRQKNARLYNERLKDIEGIETPFEPEGTSPVYHLYVIQADNRDELKKYLEEKGILSGLHYPVPLHLQEAYGFLGYKKGDFPFAEKTAKRILSLPMYPELTEEQIDYVCSSIKDFLKQ